MQDTDTLKPTTIQETAIVDHVLGCLNAAGVAATTAIDSPGIFFSLKDGYIQVIPRCQVIPSGSSLPGVFEVRRFSRGDWKSDPIEIVSEVPFELMCSFELQVLRVLARATNPLRPR